MALSDYNHLRRILDLEEAELGPGEYLVHCDTWNFWEEIQQSLAQAPMLSLAGQRLTPGTPSLRTEPMEQYQMAGNGGMPLVCRTRWHRACGEGLAGGDGPPGRGDCGAAGGDSDLPPQCTVAASAAAGENDAGKGDHGGVGPGLGGGQFAHRVYHAVLLRPLSQLGDPPALLYHFGLSPALRPGQKSAAVCHSPAAWGGQADPGAAGWPGNWGPFSSSRFSCRRG